MGTVNIQNIDVDEDTAKRIEQIVCLRVKDAVQGSATRDAQLAELDLQLEGRLLGSGKQRWKGSCTLNDPMSRQAHLQLLAMVTQAQRKSPWTTVQSSDPDNVDNAAVMETWLTRKGNQYELTTNVFYDIAYIALRDMACPLYIGWSERIRTTYPKKYHLVDDNNDLLEDFVPIKGHERDPQEVYKEVEGEPEDIVEKSGCELRACDLSDFYVYPSDSQSVKHAVATAERMLLTENQLWDGIDDYGWDEEAVETLIKMGPTHAMDSGGSLFEIRNSYDGTNTGADGIPNDGFYECFLTFTRTPHRISSELLDIPDKLKHRDIMCMVCFNRDIVFQMTESPYDERPYIMYHMLKRPNRLLGIGAMQLIATIQEEATANMQLTVDTMNMIMSPVLIAPYEWVEKYNTFKCYPGAILPEDVPNTLRPLEWNRSGGPGLELQEHFINRAMGLVSAEGYGEMQQKVRKAAEIQNVMQAADVKFDLFLQILQTPQAELAARIVALHLKFDDTMDETFMAEGHIVNVTADTLRGDYMFIPTATSATGTPEARLQITMAKIELQKEYIALMAQSPPIFQRNIWHAFRSALIDMEERNPIAYLGPEPPAVIPQPTPQPGAPLPGEVPPQIQALISAGVPPPVIQQMLGAASAGNNPASLTRGAIQNQ